jgi:hypothetical protein
MHAARPAPSDALPASGVPVGVRSQQPHAQSDSDGRRDQANA